MNDTYNRNQMFASIRISVLLDTTKIIFKKSTLLNMTKPFILLNNNDETL